MSDQNPDPNAAANADPNPPAEINASDAAKKLADENGLDLGTVTGTGANGNITKGDVETAIAAAIEAANAEADEAPAKRFSVKTRGVLPAPRFDLPGFEPTVVIGREPTVVDEATKEKIVATVKAGKVSFLSEDNLIVTEL